MNLLALGDTKAQHCRSRSCQDDTFSAVTLEQAHCHFSWLVLKRIQCQCLTSLFGHLNGQPYTSMLTPRDALLVLFCLSQFPHLHQPLCPMCSSLMVPQGPERTPWRPCLSWHSGFSFPREGHGQHSLNMCKSVRESRSLPLQNGSVSVTMMRGVLTRHKDLHGQQSPS